MAQRVAGIISVKANGTQYKAKGNWTYSLGKNVREGIAGADGVHGFKEMPTVPFIEGEITDDANLDLDALSKLEEATITLDLAVGKTVVLRQAWSCNTDGLTGQTEEGNIPTRFEGVSAQLIKG